MGMETPAFGQSVMAAFAQVPDPRSPRGRRHPVATILALATLAMLQGAHSLYAIGQWGREQPDAVVRALGFTCRRTQAVATPHYVFKRLDVVAFEQALTT